MVTNALRCDEIIEDVFKEKKPKIEIDGDHFVSIEHLLQYNKYDASKVRSIKRVKLKENRSNAHLREEN